MARLKVDQLDAVLLVALLVASACGAKTIRLVNDAMAPTLKSGHDYVVNSGAYDFVVNDNRSHLGDSRTLGFVPRSTIEGKL